MHQSHLETNIPSLTPPSNLEPSEDEQEHLFALIHKRFSDGGLQGARGARPRRGAKPKLDTKQAAMVTAIACSQAPHGRDHWTLRLQGSKIVELGFAASYSHEGVRQLLKKADSSPGKSKSGVSPEPMKNSWTAWRT